MGEVYLARDPLLRRTVAIKLLRDDRVADGAARGRFLQEARIIAGLDHPHIIGIHSVGELSDGSPYYVMDYVDGDLSDVIPEAGLDSSREAKRIVAALASALEAAHAAGVLHLDVKPSNVLYDAELREAKLSDWGIAALMVEPGADGASGSSTGLLVGSPGYMSPEQVEGEGIGPAADLYALGVLAFELLTGQRPFRGSTAAAIVAAQLRSVPQAVATLRDDVDAEFSDLIARCLSRRPQDRPTAEEVAARLKAHRGGALEWPPPGLDTLLGEGPPRGRRLVFWLGATALTVSSLMQGTALARADVGLHLVTVAAAVVGALLAIATLVRSAPLLLTVWRARRSGYDWLTLIDVIADPGGNSGAIIGGSGSFAGLAPSTRLRLVTLRRSVLCAAVASSLLLAAALCMLALLGPVFSVGQIGALWAVALGGLAAGAAVDRMTSTRPRLAAERVYRSRGSALVEAWYRSFERLHLPGARRRRTRSRVRTVTTLGALVALMSSLALLAIPSLVVGLSGRFADALLVESLGQLSRELRETRQLAQWSDLALLPRWESDGGAVLWSTLATVSADGLAAGPHRRPASHWRDLIVPLAQSGTGPPPAVVRDSLFRLAVDGLSAEQVEWIESVASEPAMQDFERAARSRSLDLTRHMWGGADMVEAGLVGPGRGMPDGWELLAVAGELEAALLLHRGEITAADEKMREALSVSWRLALGDPLWGRSAFREFGRRLDRLADFYEALDDDAGRAAGLRSTLRGLGMDDPRSNDGSDAFVDASAMALEMLESGHGSRAQRLYLARIAGLAARCGSIVEVAAGLTPQADRLLQELQRQIVADHEVADLVWENWVRNEPSDRLVRETLDRHGIRPSLASRIVPDLATRITSLLGNPRVRGCRWVIPIAELYLRL